MTQTDDARWPDRAFLFDYDLQDEAGDWKTLRGWSDATPAPMQSREYIRADLATQPDPLADPRVTALVEALQHYACDCSHACEGTSSCGDYARAAIAAFNTTGGKDE